MKGVSPVKAATIAASILEGKTPQEALVAAGYSASTAKSPGRILRDETVQRALRHALDIAGVDDAAIATVLKGALDANKVEVARHEGAISDTQEVGPDWPVRLKAAELAAGIREGHKRSWDGDGAGGSPRMVIMLDTRYQQIFFGGSPPPEVPAVVSPIPAPALPTEAQEADPSTPKPNQPSPRTALDDWK